PPANHCPGSRRVLHTGISELVTHASDELQTLIDDREHLDLLQQLKITSYIVVPLVGQERLLETIGFISTRPKFHYTQVDLAMLEELSQRAAMAIDNARLYLDA